MKGPVYIDRMEKKYQVGIRDEGLANFWRELKDYLPPYGLEPINEITNIGSIYFDNDECDLLSDCLLGRLKLIRLRTYETYGTIPEPISEYWVEMKIARDERRRKKRFRVTKGMLMDFLEGRPPHDGVFEYNRDGGEAATVARHYHDIQETILTMGLKPLLLVVYKRIAFQNTAERLSIDWDVQYYHMNTDIYDHSSWKYPIERSAGAARKTILELKYPGGAVPAWLSDLQRKYPIWEKDYLKPVEGMGCLFEGPLRLHKKAGTFLPMIHNYMHDTEPLR